MLHHVEDHHSEYAKRPVALREIRRVLRPGGDLVSSDFSRKEILGTSLAELGFTEVMRRSDRRFEVAIYRAPDRSGPGSCIPALVTERSGHGTTDAVAS